MRESNHPSTSLVGRGCSLPNSKACKGCRRWQRKWWKGRDWKGRYRSSCESTRLGHTQLMPCLEPFRTQCFFWISKAQPKQGARKKRRGGRNRGKAKQKAEQQARWNVPVSWSKQVHESGTMLIQKNNTGSGRGQEHSRYHCLQLRNKSAVKPRQLMFHDVPTFSLSKRWSSMAICNLLLDLVMPQCHITRWYPRAAPSWQPRWRKRGCVTSTRMEGRHRRLGIVGQAIYSDCNSGLHGRCKYGSDCAFAHDEHLGFSGSYPDHSP